jgi:MarR family transcriptional regulator, organic hydroperoxide resistance regulator
MAKAKKPAPGPGKPVIRSTVGVGFHLREAYRAFSRDFHARLARHGVTHAQFMILWLLSQAGSLTPLELSRRAGIQKASATSVINALKKRCLIRGDQDNADRRKINLQLTDAGVALTRDLLDCAAAANADARSGFSEKDLETLLRLLRGVVANLEGRDLRSL